MKQIVFFLFPGMEILDFAGPLQTFVEAKNHGCDLEVSFCSWKTEISASQDVFINRLRHYSEIQLKTDDIIIIPGLEHQQYSDQGLKNTPDAVFRWLVNAKRNDVILCSICSGAFILAHAGLLNGRSCTTHWSRIDELQKRYPESNVKTDYLFLHDQGVYTSAGITAGIDLSLAIVEKYWGPNITSKVAQELVVYIRRNSNHQQKTVYLDYREHHHPTIHKIQDWIISNPRERPSIAFLADKFGMSERNLTRTFKKVTGLTVTQFSTLLTLEHARNLLKNPDNTVESVAVQCGFHDARQLRKLWVKHYGVSPSQERV